MQTVDSTPISALTKIERGTPEFRRVRLALFLAGLSTFTLLYSAQPLLPMFSQIFGVPAATSSLALSLTTTGLAASILFASVVGERYGRKRIIGISLVSAAICNVLAAFAPNWHMLLVLRTIEGFALGGTPALAMAYIAEEIAPGGLASVMGLYIGGNAIGGMSGRVIVGAVAEYFGWRPALGTIGLVSLCAAIGLLIMLPPSRHFQAQPDIRLRYHLAAWAAHLRNPRLRWYDAIGFLAMGAFVSIYNYTGYRLERAPYNLGTTAQGAIFLVYLFGTLASAMSGTLGDRFGRARLLNGAVLVCLVGALLMLAAPLPVIIFGIVLVTMGFFVAHSSASSAIGKLALTHKGHASSLYLLFYYLGSSAIGPVGGLCWTHWAWPGVVACVAVCLLVTLAISTYLARTAPVLATPATVS